MNNAEKLLIFSVRYKKGGDSTIAAHGYEEMFGYSAFRLYTSRIL